MRGFTDWGFSHVYGASPKARAGEQNQQREGSQQQYPSGACPCLADKNRQLVHFVKELHYSFHQAPAVNAYREHEPRPVRFCYRESRRKPEPTGGIVDPWIDDPAVDRGEDVAQKYRAFSTRNCKKGNDARVP